MVLRPIKDSLCERYLSSARTYESVRVREVSVLRSFTVHSIQSIKLYLPAALF